MPAAVVTITAADTAQSRRVVTGADGSFVAANLAPGMVNVDVAAPGFRDVKREGVALEVGQAASVVVELTLESVRVNVNVEGGIGVIAVDTSRSVVDAVIRSALIDVLPLNGRNFLELALLVPGNTPAPNFDPTKSNSVVISSAGQLGRGGNIMIDGSDNNDDVVGGPLLNVTEESVQEFQIATNRFSAETGRSAGSAINVVTKSGTDRLRGSASLFARDQRWQSLPATLRQIRRCQAAVRSAAGGRVGRWSAGARNVLVRSDRIPEPGWRNAGWHERRRAAGHPAHVCARSPRRPAWIGTVRLAREGAGLGDGALCR